MRIVSSNGNIGFKAKPRCIATIGVFDGVHLGHGYLLQKVIQEAREQELETLLISFCPHPRLFYSSGPRSSRRASFAGYLTTQFEKTEILQKLGLDYFWNIRFDKEVSEMSGADFVNYIFNSFDIKKIIVGNDFKFGYKAESNVDDLSRICKGRGVEVEKLQKKKIDGISVNSSFVRNLIKKAEFKKAKSFLGRPYGISGEVERGRGIGSEKLDAPTINIDVDKKVLPPFGVYITRANLKGEFYAGVSNLGLSSTKKKNKPLLETHLLNFNKSVYKDFFEVFFLKKIREEEDFNSLEELKIAIKKDINLTKKFFSNYDILCLP